jgi:sulfonate transport system substrate-binding protein
VPVLRSRLTSFPTRATAVGVGLCLLAGCGSSARAASSGSDPSPAAAQVSVPSTIPPGVTLRVGDQLGALETDLKISGQDQSFPYKVDYSSFVGGPPMLQAFEAGAIDVGFVGSTPLIFAQAGGQAIHAVAGWATQSSVYSLVVPPGKTGVSGWADLKGKKVAFQQGTALEAVVLEGLASAGLKYSDITPVNLPTTEISQALVGGSADAGILVEPLTSVYLASNPDARVIATAASIADRSDFLIATTSTLSNPGKEAALADYLNRLVKAFAYLEGHPQTVVQAVYEDQYHLSAARAEVVEKEVGGTNFVTLPGAVVASQQRVADLYYGAGEIPSQVNVSSEFDSRFNSIISSGGRG